jgi:hypothetical protein
VEKGASSVKKERLPPILDAQRVGDVSRAMLDFLRRNLGGNLPLSLPQVEETVRFFPVAEHCSAVRERKGLTISDAAKQLKVPQYRLKAIESCLVAEVKSDVLHAYIKFLGLSGWYGKWARSQKAGPRLGPAGVAAKGGAV